jgi:hypothetical protein
MSNKASMDKLAKEKKAKKKKRSTSAQIEEAINTGRHGASLGARNRDASGKKASLKKKASAYGREQAISGVNQQPSYVQLPGRRRLRRSMFVDDEAEESDTEETPQVPVHQIDNAPRATTTLKKKKPTQQQRQERQWMNNAPDVDEDVSTLFADNEDDAAAIAEMERLEQQHGLQPGHVRGIATKFCTKAAKIGAQIHPGPRGGMYYWSVSSSGGEPRKIYCREMGRERTARKKQEMRNAKAWFKGISTKRLVRGLEKRGDKLPRDKTNREAVLRKYIKLGLVPSKEAPKTN